MTIDIVGLLVAFAVLCLLWWALNALMRASGVGDPLATYVRVAFVVIVVLVLLATFTGYGPHIRLR